MSKRNQVEALLYYSFIVDSMPTDDLPQLPTEQINRILNLVFCSKKDNESITNTSQFISEVKLEYGRTMCKILLDSMLYISFFEHASGANKDSNSIALLKNRFRAPNRGNRKLFTCLLCC